MPSDAGVSTPPTNPVADALARLERPGSRRAFLRLVSSAGGALALASLGGLGALGGCADGSGPEDRIHLDLAQPIDVLRYGFVVEATVADYFDRAVTASGFGVAFPGAAERVIMADVRDHHVAHRELLRAVIEGAAASAPDAGVRWPSSLDFSSRDAVLATARTLSDLAVAAWAGATPYLAGGAALLTLAGKIGSVDARHASAIRDLVQPAGAHFADVTDLAPLGADESKGLDAAAAPDVVLDALAGYRSRTITTAGL